MRNHKPYTPEHATIRCAVLAKALTALKWLDQTSNRAKTQHQTKIAELGHELRQVLDDSAREVTHGRP